MEPNEEAIEMLGKRMRSQMGRPSEKSIDAENLQYYLSHVMTPRRDIWQEIRGEEKDADEWMTDGRDSGYQDADALQAASRLDGNQPIYPIPDITEEMASAAYKNLLADAQYREKVGKMAQMMGQKGAPEAGGVQHARARSGYEKVSQDQNGTGISRISRRHLFDMKG